MSSVQRPAVRLVGALIWTLAVGLAAAAAQTTTPPAWQPSYHFDVGDNVEFKFLYTPELNFTAPVRPDGAISFPYLGDVKLLGLTVAELTDALRKQYTGVLRTPDVTVIVHSFQALRVFVTGEVPAPGRLDFRPGMTIVQAVAAAGGFRDSANRKQVVLLRPQTPTALSVTLVSVETRGATASDLPLGPDDIVLVVKSGIARLGQIVQQYSRDLLPFSSLGLFFNLTGSTNAVLTVNKGGG
jgi:protein involved in polysaccharide export with SLBB domain